MVQNIDAYMKYLQDLADVVDPGLATKFMFGGVVIALGAIIGLVVWYAWFRRIFRSNETLWKFKSLGFATVMFIALVIGNTITIGTSRARNPVVLWNNCRTLDKAISYFEYEINSSDVKEKIEHFKQVLEENCTLQNGYVRQTFPVF